MAAAVVDPGSLSRVCELRAESELREVVQHRCGRFWRNGQQLLRPELGYHDRPSGRAHVLRQKLGSTWAGCRLGCVDSPYDAPDILARRDDRASLRDGGGIHHDAEAPQVY